MDKELPPYSAFLISDAHLYRRNLADHHLSSMNHLYTHGIPQIVSEGFRIESKFDNLRNDTEEDKKIARISFSVRFGNVKISKPMDRLGNQNIVLYPNKAIVSQKTYSSDVYTDITVSATKYYKDESVPPFTREDTLQNQALFKIPIMVRSNLCNTYKMSDTEMLQVGEDPDDCGGYFIINGIEWVISCVENVPYNQMRIYKNEGYGKEVVRSEIISKPGDLYQNSGEAIVRFNNNKSITVNMFYDPFKEMFVPLFTFFRLLGCNSDKEMVSDIVLTDDDHLSGQIVEELRQCMTAHYDRFEEHGDISQVYGIADNVKMLTDVMRDDEFKKYPFEKRSDEAYQMACSKIMACVDINFLPHVGMTKEDRRAKLRYLGLMIYNMFLVKYGIRKSTDRDSLMNKRVQPAGMSYAKPFKSYFNRSVAATIGKQLRRDFEVSSFSDVSLLGCIKTHNYMEKFEQLLMKAIKAGTKAKLHLSHNRDIINRLTSKQLGRKNPLRTVSTVRQITTTSADNAKQTNRAKIMRLYQPSYIGYICALHSPVDGAKVGINKNMTINAMITLPSPKALLEMALKEIPIFTPLGKISSRDIVAHHLSNIYINGDWVGVSHAPLEIANIFREKRRNIEINQHVGIWWDVTQNSLYLYSDMGRMTRPLIIVYNNTRDMKRGTFDWDESKEFTQGTALNVDHVKRLLSGKMGMDDLLREKIVEFICVEEQENCLICPDLETLVKDSNDELKEYTHCDLPASVYGFTALACPFATHNQPIRVTYQTCQGAQTCGRYVGNWFNRCDNDTFLQYKNEVPLCSTITNRYIESSGLNCIVAIACYGGYNQEDSLIINKGAVDRGAFLGCKFSLYQSQLDSNESFGPPKTDKTIKLKNANYEKLEPSGAVPVGILIKTGDVIIGKMEKTSNGQFADKSVVYHETEDAVVHNVIWTTVKGDESSNRLCKVCLRKPRPPTIGDKFSSRNGQKGILSQFLSDGDMPFDKNGLRPTIIMNPHAIPSRMTIGQLYESMINTLNAYLGTQIDASAFNKFDIDAVGDALVKAGLNRHGYSRLYNGMTGEPMDAEIFVGSTYYQRLNKFVEETIYSMEHGPTDLMTRQPLDGGRQRSGGLRLGEMELWCLHARGASRLVSEKIREHSDGMVEYICRCGRPAIYHKGDAQSETIYRCPECKDNAEIYAVPSTTSAKLFTQEVESMNFGFNREIMPCVFEVGDSK